VAGSCTFPHSLSRGWILPRAEKGLFHYESVTARAFVSGVKLGLLSSSSLRGQKEQESKRIVSIARYLG